MKAETSTPVSMTTLLFFSVSLPPHRIDCPVYILHRQLRFPKRFSRNLKGRIQPVFGWKDRKDIVLRVNLFRCRPHILVLLDNPVNSKTKKIVRVTRVRKSKWSCSFKSKISTFGSGLQYCNSPKAVRPKGVSVKIGFFGLFGLSGFSGLFGLSGFFGLFGLSGLSG